jgi:hypothetical protein
MPNKHHEKKGVDEPRPYIFNAGYLSCKESPQIPVFFFLALTLSRFLAS